MQVKKQASMYIAGRTDVRPLRAAIFQAREVSAVRDLFEAAVERADLLFQFDHARLEVGGAGTAIHDDRRTGGTAATIGLALKIGNFAFDPVETVRDRARVHVAGLGERRSRGNQRNADKRHSGNAGKDRFHGSTIGPQSNLPFGCQIRTLS
jgi:hypothetical protein